MSTTSKRRFAVCSSSRRFCDLPTSGPTTRCGQTRCVPVPRGQDRKKHLCRVCKQDDDRPEHLNCLRHQEHKPRPCLRRQGHRPRFGASSSLPTTRQGNENAGKNVWHAGATPTTESRLVLYRTRPPAWQTAVAEVPQANGVVAEDDNPGERARSRACCPAGSRSKSFRRRTHG